MASMPRRMWMHAAAALHSSRRAPTRPRPPRVRPNTGKLAGLDKKLSKSLDESVQTGSSPLELSMSPVGPLSESSRCRPPPSSSTASEQLSPRPLPGSQHAHWAAAVLHPQARACSNQPVETRGGRWWLQQSQLAGALLRLLPLSRWEGRASNARTPPPHVRPSRSRKTLIYLILTLNHIYPDYDFSQLRAHHFRCALAAGTPLQVRTRGGGAAAAALALQLVRGTQGPGDGLHAHRARAGLRLECPLHCRPAGSRLPWPRWSSCLTLTWWRCPRWAAAVLAGLCGARPLSPAARQAAPVGFRRLTPRQSVLPAVPGCCAHGSWPVVAPWACARGGGVLLRSLTPIALCRRGSTRLVLVIRRSWTRCGAPWTRWGSRRALPSHGRHARSHCRAGSAAAA